MADDGASMPVASAIATGNASTIAMAPERPLSAVVRPVCATGAPRPPTSTATPATMNSIVIAANTARPMWPNDVIAATKTSRATARGTRSGASPGRESIAADAPAAALIAIVSTKSTMSAPIGTNALASPNALPAAAAARRPRESARRAGGSS